MWLVAERVFFRKMQFARDNGVDINQLDLTPEGLAEDSSAMGFPLLTVGTSSVLYGSFANAWPYGSVASHSWEKGSQWAESRWQDPFHIHRALVPEFYSGEVTPEIQRVFLCARREHHRLNAIVKFFEDIHSSFVSIEEAWAKGYASATEEPAKLEPLGGGGGTASSGRGSESARAQDFSFDPNFQEPRFRTRVLEAFLQLRNKILIANPDATPREFPHLELQYSRLYGRQEDSPVIRGSDLTMHFPDGRVIPLSGKVGEFRHRPAILNEGMEALWLDHFVSKFGPNNCPRIVLP